MPERRILVTGGDGFVGRHLLRHLSRRWPDAVISAPRRDGLDITDPDAVTAAVADLKPTGVVHLAAIAAPREAHAAPHRAWTVNVMGTLNLVEAVLGAAPDAVFVQVGSSEAYGATFKTAEKPVPETVPLDPNTVYAATKAAAETVVAQRVRDGLRAVRMRPFNHTGPGQTADYVVPAFASQIAAIERGAQEPVLRVGNLEARRDFLDVRDVVRAYALALEAPGALGRAINVASGTGTRIGDILEGLVALSSVEITVMADPARMRPNEVPLASGDRAQAEALLGWAPEIALEATLRDVLDDCRGRPDTASR